MQQLECPTCSVKFQESDAVVQCIDCETRKHARCAKVDPKKFGKRHWRCKECSRKKDPERKPKSAVSRTLARHTEEMAAGDSSHKASSCSPVTAQDIDKDPWEMQFNRSLEKMKQLEELVILLKDKYYEISKKNDELEAELATYKLKVENLEQEIRKNTVDVWGVPVGEKDNLRTIVTNLFRTVGFKDKENQVESVGKVKKSEADFHAGIRFARVDPSVPRTVIWINFLTDRGKDEFMNKWKAQEQKGGITVRQLGVEGDGQVKVETSLTPYKLQLFQRAMDYANEFKYKRVGVCDGEIYLLKDVSSGPMVFIRSSQDFERLAELDMHRLVGDKVKAAAADTAEKRKPPAKTPSRNNRMMPGNKSDGREGRR